ncbi:MAG: 50S ribosomal protein L11 methyltransferase [Solirubrobacteraceae bacterium]
MIRLALRVRRAQADLVLAELLELAPDGVEEIESDADEGDGFVEYAVYGAPGELPELPDLKAAAGGAFVEVSTSELPDDWSERWKRFHRPVLIELDPEGGLHGGGLHGGGLHGGGLRGAVPALHVRPPWESPTERTDAREIVIDPAQAFGTGAHATTRLCLELLLGLTAEGLPGADGMLSTESTLGPVLDVGAGSGVLAIAAAKLGYGPVLALDNDRESVLAIADNAARNSVQIEARHFDLRREALPPVNGGPAPIVLANLLRPLLLDLAGTMATTDGSVATARLDLIAGGLLREQADEVAVAFAKRLGLRERARRERGEWAALWLTSAR